MLRYYDEAYVDRVRAYRGTFPYEKALRKRRVWVEPLFGEAKDWHGLRRFRLRRLEKVNAEALLTAAGQNVKRLMAFGGRRPRKLAQVGALRPPRRLSNRSRRHNQTDFSTTRTSPQPRFSTGWQVEGSRQKFWYLLGRARSPPIVSLTQLSLQGTQLRELSRSLHALDNHL